MKLTATMIYYYVSDMDRAIAFYNGVLGLPVSVRFENNWAEMDAGPVTIGLHPTENGGKPKKGGGTISCNVSDIEKFVSDIKAKGAKVGKIHSPERGKFVMISDPDGNEIHVVEFDPKWVKEKKYKA
jgi:predicted enzyme related to lactoylglutathione lyase